MLFFFSRTPSLQPFLAPPLISDLRQSEATPSPWRPADCCQFLSPLLFLFDFSIWFTVLYSKSLCQNIKGSNSLLDENTRWWSKFWIWDEIDYFMFGFFSRRVVVGRKSWRNKLKTILSEKNQKPINRTCGKEKHHTF